MGLGTLEDIRDRLDLSALGKPAIIGLAALLLMVAVFAGKNIVDAATASTFTIERGEASAAAPPSDEAISSAPSCPESLTAQNTTPTTTVFVHVAGAVANPGLVKLEQDARVADAIQAAGGFSEDAAIESVNLARKVSDGEQVYVSSTDDSGGSGNPFAESQAPAISDGGLVNLNTATSSELESLPGIGPSTAEKIIADRTANGPFSSVDDLTRISGIGEKKLEAIAELVCV